MRIGTLRRFGAVALTAAAITGATTTGAASAATPVPLEGGRTSVTTAPGLAGALVANGILPVTTLPGKTAVTTNGGTLALRVSFPVTGGSIDPATLAGQIEHKGGITFVNTKNGKSLNINSFIVDTVAGQLTARVANTTTRVPVFNLDLSKATVNSYDDGEVVRVGNITATLTSVAAGALNGALGTNIFAGGLTFGTAVTTLELGDDEDDDD